jgi:hypothetical protein
VRYPEDQGKQWDFQSWRLKKKPTKVRHNPLQQIKTAEKGKRKIFDSS